MAVTMFFAGRLYDLDARWLTFWFERKIYVVPRADGFRLYREFECHPPNGLRA
jgi:hypothetical protein